MFQFPSRLWFWNMGLADTSYQAKINLTVEKKVFLSFLLLYSRLTFTGCRLIAARASLMCLWLQISLTCWTPTYPPTYRDRSPRTRSSTLLLFFLRFLRFWNVTSRVYCYSSSVVLFDLIKPVPFNLVALKLLVLYLLWKLKPFAIKVHYFLSWL